MHIPKLLSLVLAIVLSLVIPVRAQSLKPPLGQGAKRFALLIGVDRYREDGYQHSTDASRVQLRNLSNPCSDARAIGAQLERLGWRGEFDDSPELEVVCDANWQNVQKRLRELVDYVNEGKFLMIYLAGHGAEVNRINYFFPSLTSVDLLHAKERWQRNHGAKLFAAEAIDLNEEIIGAAGDGYRGDLLVILDICRDDPINYRALRDGIGLGPMPSPQLDSDIPGIGLFFATQPGRRVSDGVGSSYLAESLVRHMRPNIQIDDILRAVRNEVHDETYRGGNDKKQTPTFLGGFRTSDLCFAGCGSGSYSSNIFDAPQESRFFSIAGALLGIKAANAAEAKSGTVAPPSRTIGKALEGLEDGVNVDVFWCQGAEGAEDRQRRAEAIVAMLESRRRDPEEAQVLAKTARIRLRPFLEDDNARSGYRISSDVIRIDTLSKTERLLADALKLAAGQVLAVQEVRTPTPSYVSVFMCDGVKPVEPSTRLFVQVPRDDAIGAGTIMSDQIRKNFHGVWVAGVEVKPISPNQNELRYGADEDKAKATEIAARLAKTFDQAINVKRNPKQSAKAGNLELWLGKQSTLELLPIPKEILSTDNANSESPEGG